jgi:hypothetical protein
MPDGWHDERFLRTSVALITAFPGQETLQASQILLRFKGQVSVCCLYSADWCAEWETAFSESILSAPTRSLGFVAGADPVKVCLRLTGLLAEWQPKFVFAPAEMISVAARFATEMAVSRRRSAGAMVPALMEYGSGSSATGARRFSVAESVVAVKRHMATLIGATDLSLSDNEWTNASDEWTVPETFRGSETRLSEISVYD